MLMKGVLQSWLHSGDGRTARNRGRVLLNLEALEAREVPSAGWGNYKSGLASVSAPGVVKAGDYVTVSVNAGSSAAVSMSFADPSEVYVNGAKTAATGGVATLYNYDSPGISPDGGAKVSITAGSHSIKFKINAEAPDAKPELVSSTYSSYQYWKGPFVVVGGSFYGKPWSTPVGFEIDGVNHGDVNLSAQIASPHGAEAFPGDTLTIRLTARTSEPNTVLKQFSLQTYVPGGAVLVPNSFVGGAPSVSGSRLTWTKTERDTYRNAISVSFKVQVKSEEQLGQIRTLLSRSTATYVTKAGYSKSRSIEKEMKVVRATQIHGTAFDVDLQFPQMNSVLTNRTLSDATVKLFEKGSGRLVATEATASDGKYVIHAPKHGVYILEISKKADRYFPGSEQLTKDAWTVRQRREVKIEKDRTTPIAMDNLHLPVSIVNRTAALMQKLHDVRPQILGGIVNAVVEPVFPNFMRFGYDLSAVEQLVHRAVTSSAAEKFNGVYTGTGEKDLFNGLIRVNAYMELLVHRLDATLKHADIFAKATALMISTNLIPALGAARKQPKLTQVEQVAKFTALNLKIVTMSLVIPNALNVLFAHLKLPAKARDMISAVVFNVARYTFDKYTGQTVDDLLFEVIFTGVRTALTAGYVKASLTGALGVRGTQSVLNEAASLALRKVYADDTNATLASMERLWGKVDDRSKFVEGVSSYAQQALNITRVITGLRDVYVGGSEATGNPIPPGSTGLIGKILDKMNAKIWPLLPDQKASATPAQWFRQAFKATMLYMLPLYVLPIGMPVLELYAVDPYMEAIGKGSMSGPLPDASEPYPSSLFSQLWTDLASFVPVSM